LGLRTEILPLPEKPKPKYLTALKQATFKFISTDPKQDFDSYKAYLAEATKENISNGNLNIPFNPDNQQASPADVNCDVEAKKRNIINHTTGQRTIMGHALGTRVTSKTGSIKTTPPSPP
jgi:hypothetical protein